MTKVQEKGAVIWTNERYVSQALTAPFRYRTLSLSDRGHVNLRLSFSTLHHRGSTRTVVATDPVSVDADCDNETTLQFQACHGLSKPRQKVFPRTRVNMGQRETDPAIWFLTS
jgi:hypothetical protein